MADAEPLNSPDDVLLDEIFDRALEQIEEGLTVEIDDLIGRRRELRSQAERMLRLAREVAVIRPGPLPVLAGYEILSELGRGGMGTVYLARQERLGGRHVALKVLPHSATISSRSRERFLNEARAIAKLRHPNIVAIHDVVEDGQTLAYAMERIEGASLAEVLDGDRPDPGWVCRLGVSIGRALGAVHASGLLHRDVKPSNILLRADGTPLLADFGLVRDADTAGPTEAGHFIGTAAYAAPEQLRGESEAVDARSDIYGLGATLYHALAGRVPFRGRSTAEILRRAEEGIVEPLRRVNRRLPRDLQTIIAKAIDPNPARRYQRAEDLADDLERLLQFRPIRARPTGLVRRTTKLIRRNRGAVTGAVIGGVIVLAAAVGLALYALWLPARIEASVRDAQVELLDT